MTTTKGIIGLYWGDRYATATRAAQNLAATLDALATAESLLAGWKRGGDSPESALSNPVLETDEASLASQLNETDGCLTWSAWNGVEVATAQLSIYVGSIDTKIRPNSVLLRLPSPSDIGLYEPGPAADIFDGLVSIWSPDRAAFSNSQISLGLRGYPFERTRALGWITYRSDSLVAELDPAEEIVRTRISRGVRLGIDRKWAEIDAADIVDGFTIESDDAAEPRV